ncbi:MAG: hypothetical protein PVSMB4_16400 [Ktedonobacterales bacterium]
MRHIRVLVCAVDETTPEQMTALASYDLPAADVRTLQPETALDDLEAQTQQTGHAVLRRMLQAQWEVLDEQAAAEYRRRFSP